MDDIPVSVQQAMSLAFSPAPRPPSKAGKVCEKDWRNEERDCAVCGISGMRPKGPFFPTNVSFLVVSRLSRAGYVVK